MLSKHLKILFAPSPHRDQTTSNQETKKARKNATGYLLFHSKRYVVLWLSYPDFSLVVVRQSCSLHLTRDEELRLAWHCGVWGYSNFLHILVFMGTFVVNNHILYGVPVSGYIVEVCSVVSPWENFFTSYWCFQFFTFQSNQPQIIVATLTLLHVYTIIAYL